MPKFNMSDADVEMFLWVLARSKPNEDILRKQYPDNPDIVDMWKDANWKCISMVGQMHPEESMRRILNGDKRVFALLHFLTEAGLVHLHDSLINAGLPEDEVRFMFARELGRERGHIRTTISRGRKSKLEKTQRKLAARIAGLVVREFLRRGLIEGGPKP